MKGGLCSACLSLSLLFLPMLSACRCHVTSVYCQSDVIEAYSLSGSHVLLTFDSATPLSRFPFPFSLFAYLNSHPVPPLVRRMPVRNEYPPRPWPEFPLSAPGSTDRPMRSADEDALHFCHCRRNLWHFPSWGGPEGTVPFREIIHSPQPARKRTGIDRERDEIARLKSLCRCA